MTVVLFTCAGQRVDIVTAFRRAGATTLAVDVSELAPALYHADRRALVPRVDDPDYVDALRALVELHDVRLVVPLADLDHLLLAEQRDRLGALVLLPGPDTIRLCEDKYRAHEFFDARGIPTPPTWLPGELPDGLEFPVLVKPRRGFASKHIFRADDRAELDFFLARTSEDSMVQAVCRGEEFSIDVFCDLDARCLNAVPRTMIESKGGESIKGMTVQDRELIEHGRRVAEELGIVGPANVQCFREPDGSLPVTDVNPRFGGAFPLPTAAGSRYPELALALANGERPEPRLGDFRAGVVMTRFFSEVVLRDADGTLELLEELSVPERVRHGRGVRRLAPVALAAALLAGCGGSASKPVSAPPPPAPAPVTTKPAHPAATVRGARWVHKVEVTVLDGDTGRRVAGAHVRIGSHSALADARGAVLVPFPRHAGVVHVAAPGYVAKTIRLYFRSFPRSTVRVYRLSAQWPMYGVDAARTQAQSEIRLRPPFRVVWTHGVGDLIEFPAVVSEGVAYIGNARGTVFALSMDDGHVIWRRATPHGEMAASAAIWGGRLVVHQMDGTVSVRRRADGRLVARLGAGAPIESSPVVRDGIDYFGAWNGVVRALDLRHGRTVWTYRSGCKITSSAAIAGATVFIGDYCGRLLALDRATGRLRWAGRVDGRIYGTPAVAAGRVFVGSSDGGSMNAFTTGGRFLWHRNFGSYVYSSPAAWHGRVFFGTYGGTFFALSAASGRTLWAVPTGGAVSGAAVVVDGVAYAGSFSHRIVGVDALTGRVVLDFPHGEYVPVSGGGQRLLLHGYSRLFAVEER